MENAKASSAPSDLFDHLHAWRHEPSLAFKAFLASDQFAMTRGKSARPRPSTMSDESAGIYALMFQRFIDHVKDAQKTLPEAGLDDVQKFVCGVLAGVSNETQKRYVRLIERVYDHLVNASFVETNPVSEWVLRDKQQRPPGREVAGGLDCAESQDLIAPDQVAQLLEWLSEKGVAAAEHDEWRDARDFTLAALGLGTGMRFFELTILQKDQVDYTPRHADDRFAININYQQTVRTSTKHRTHAEQLCADVMETWWGLRWNKGFRTTTAPSGRFIAEGQYVFPAGLRIPKPKVVAGKPKTPRNKHVGTLEKSSVYRALKAMALDALSDGVLDQSTRWVLERGAQGLRRAYVLNGLLQGSDSRTLSDRLGLLDKDSIRAYERELDAAARRLKVPR